MLASYENRLRWRMRIGGSASMCTVCVASRVALGLLVTEVTWMVKNPKCMWWHFDHVNLFAPWKRMNPEHNALATVWNPGWISSQRTCYDSFFFICRSSFASLPSLRTVLWNAFHLNTASFLHTVHGSLTPFPPTFYGRPSLTRITSTRLLPIYRTAQAFPLYPPWFLCYEHCLVRALHSHLFKRRYYMYSP